MNQRRIFPLAFLWVLGGVALLAGGQEHTQAPRPEYHGVVPETVYRPMAPAKEPNVSCLLQRFAIGRQEFPWRMTLLHKSPSTEVHAVQFPSPYHSAMEQNNTVHGEYFPVDKSPPRPAVIVLHISDGQFVLARIICQHLASQQINALLVKMPYYGPRRSEDEDVDWITENPEQLVQAVTQAVMDVRRAACWLSTRPEVDSNRIGLCGVSLGGFVAALTGGVDGQFGRSAILLAGGDLYETIANHSSEVHRLQKVLAKDEWTEARVRQLLHPVDPLTYAHRLRQNNVLMINGRDDQVVPASCAQKLADASGATLRWYPAGHYSMVAYVPECLKLLTEYFSADPWVSASENAVQEPKIDKESNAPCTKAVLVDLPAVQDPKKTNEAPSNTEVNKIGSR